VDYSVFTFKYHHPPCIHSLSLNYDAERGGKIPVAVIIIA